MAAWRGAGGGRWTPPPPESSPGRAHSGRRITSTPKVMVNLGRGPSVKKHANFWDAWPSPPPFVRHRLLRAAKSQRNLLCYVFTLVKLLSPHHLSSLSNVIYGICLSGNPLHIRLDSHQPSSRQHSSLPICDQRGRRRRRVRPPPPPSHAETAEQPVAEGPALRRLSQQPRPRQLVQTNAINKCFQVVCFAIQHMIC